MTANITTYIPDYRNDCKNWVSIWANSIDLYQTAGTGVCTIRNSADSFLMYCQRVKSSYKALDKGEYLLIIRDNFC